MAPRAVTLVKRLVRGISAEQATRAAAAALASRTAAEAEAVMLACLNDAFPEGSRAFDGLPV